MLMFCMVIIFIITVLIVSSLIFCTSMPQKGHMKYALAMAIMILVARECVKLVVIRTKEDIKNQRNIVIKVICAPAYFLREIYRFLVIYPVATAECISMVALALPVEIPKKVTQKETNKMKSFAKQRVDDLARVPA